MTGLMPNYGRIQARYGAESERPNLWTGLRALWTPPVTPTGLTWRDQSMHRRDGALTNMDPGTDWVMSPYGWALDFAGADRKVLVPNFTLASNWTIHFLMWGEEDAPADSAGIMVCGDDTSNNFVYCADGFRVRYQNDAGTNVSWAGDTDFYHRWRAVSLAADATGVTLYLDGASQGRQVIAPSFVLEVIGLGHTHEPFDFSGKLASFLLHSRCLLPSEIADLHADPFAMLRRRRAVYAAPFVPYPYPRHELTGGLAV